jgi:putative heme-binding domain-containing protein
MWTGGLVLRIDEDGGGLRVLAHNFRNNYEVAVDAFGDLYVSDNDDDGSQGCRALWTLPRSNHGYISSDGARYWNADRKPGQDVRRAHWHQDDPGVSPMGTILGAGGPTGVALIENAALGEPFDGWMLAADAGASVVYGLAPSEVGARVELERQEFVAARAREGDGGKSHWFRPSDVLIGTDGALYVADWYDPGVGGHAMGDKVGYGRILRIAREGAGTALPSIDLNTTGGRIAALASPAVNVRGRAARALLQDPKATVALGAMKFSAQGAQGRVLARARWILAALNAAPPSTDGASDEVRQVIVELRARPMQAKQLLSLAQIPNARLQSELALQLEDNASSEALSLWLGLAKKFDGTDRTYLEALGIAARGHEAELYAALTSSARDPLSWNAGMAGLAWRLHVPASVPAIRSRAMAAELSLEARIQAIDTLAFTQDRSAGEALLDIALAGPKDAREKARWWIRFRDTNDWRAWKLGAQLPGDDREGAKLLYESPLMEKGALKIDVDLSGATRLYLVVDDGGNGNGCDWADWIEPRLVFADGEKSLCDLDWSDARAGWGQVLRNSNCNGGSLSVGGKPFARGIGTHAASEIAYALPQGQALRLRATIGPDDQGVAQGCGTSVRFRVFAEIKIDPALYTGLESRVLDASLSQAQRAAAAAELCATREGGLHALSAAAGGRWSEEAKRLLAPELFKNTDLAVRALASEHFPRAAGSMPSIAALEKLLGDERRGEAVYFGAAANCASCHTFLGRGGDVGPALSTLRQKYAPGAVFDAILNPNAGIAFGFETWLFETSDERIVSGFLLADGENVILKDSAGVRTMIPKEEIVSRRKAKVSAMPDNVATGLSAQELADVVAFLLADREAPRKLGAPIELFNGSDLSAWTYYLNDPKAQMSDVWSVVDGVLDCKGNPAGYLMTKDSYEDFVLELDWRFPAGGEPGNSGVLLRKVGADKVWPKSVEAQLQHRSAGDIWNIDAVSMQVHPARTNGRNTKKLAPCNEVPQGEWNHYKIVLDRGDMSLIVNGQLQNTATWIERVAGPICLQSEGSRIQFRNISLRKLE